MQGFSCGALVIQPLATASAMHPALGMHSKAGCKAPAFMGHHAAAITCLAEHEIEFDHDDELAVHVILLSGDAQGTVAAWDLCSRPLGMPLFSLALHTAAVSFPQLKCHC